MSSEKLKETLSKIITQKMNSMIFIETIRDRLEKNPKLRLGIGKRDKNIVSLADIISVEHPVLAKLIDIGNLTRKLDRALSSEFNALSKFLDSDVEAVKIADKILSKAKEEMISNLLETVESGGRGLRPILMPGTVDLSEVTNLYYRNEGYSKTDKQLLAYYLFNSLCIGDSIAVFFIGEFMDYLKGLVNKKLFKNYLDADDIHAGRWELNYPFTTLTRLIIWIFENLLEDVDNREEIILRMKESSGLIYFTPYRKKEEYTAIVFPQLSRFVSEWIENKSKRNAIKLMLDAAKNISAEAYRAGKTPKIEILYDNVELVSRALIESSYIAWEPLRKVVDILVEMMSKYEVKGNLYFVRLLGKAS